MARRLLRESPFVGRAIGVDGIFGGVAVFAAQKPEASGYIGSWYGIDNGSNLCFAISG